MHICIIGAGVIGVTTAYYLRQQGHTITLVDTASLPAASTSFANGGQLSYSYISPLAGPGVLKEAIGWMLKSNSPLRFRPRLSLEQWRWGLNFAKACTTERSRKTTIELLALAELSRKGLHQLQAQHNLNFDYAKNGKLIIHRDINAFEAAKAQVNYQAQLGSSQSILSSEQCIALEPDLKNIAGSLCGGIYTASEEVGNCRLFTEGLVDLMQQDSGFELLLNHSIDKLTQENGSVVAAESARGPVQADAFVITAGLGSIPLLSPLRVRVPLYPLKGYSLSIPAADAGITLTCSITDYAQRIVYARLGPILRIAGLVELGTHDKNINRNAVKRLQRQAIEAFPHLNSAASSPWAGLRPATAQGKPIIDYAPGYKNLWMNLGHGGLGFTLACGSAQLLACRMSDQPPPIIPTAFAYSAVH